MTKAMTKTMTKARATPNIPKLISADAATRSSSLIVFHVVLSEGYGRVRVWFMVKVRVRVRLRIRVAVRIGTNQT
jgi:hypothetical protein